MKKEGQKEGANACKLGEERDRERVKGEKKNKKRIEKKKKTFFLSISRSVLLLSLLHVRKHERERGKNFREPRGENVWRG